MSDEWAQRSIADVRERLALLDAAIRRTEAHAYEPARAASRRLEGLRAVRSAGAAVSAGRSIDTRVARVGGLAAGLGSPVPEVKVKDTQQIVEWLRKIYGKDTLARVG